MRFFLLSVERSFPRLRVLGIYVPYEGGGGAPSSARNKQTWQKDLSSEQATLHLTRRPRGMQAA